MGQKFDQFYWFVFSRERNREIHPDNHSKNTPAKKIPERHSNSECQVNDMGQNLINFTGLFLAENEAGKSTRIITVKIHQQKRYQNDTQTASVK